MPSLVLQACGRENTMPCQSAQTTEVANFAIYIKKSKSKLKIKNKYKYKHRYKYFHRHSCWLSSLTDSSSSSRRKNYTLEEEELPVNRYK